LFGFLDKMERFSKESDQSKLNNGDTVHLKELRTFIDIAILTTTVVVYISSSARALDA